ncbi:MAG: tRNA (adenosine(37)-N6)-threonylcarbamoyltransferase complex ATPase subunit type 1 TsaE [Rhodospirillales bacterium]
MIARHLGDEAATARLAAVIAGLARPGDVIALHGDLGAGKTAFARGFIAACAAVDGAPEEEVPSPTFTLVQTYPFRRFVVHHFDLYRIDRPEDARELGLEEAMAGGVALIEWPERLGPLLPADRLDVTLTFVADDGARHLTLSGTDDWMRRLAACGDV